MALLRVNPASWGIGDKYTSAQCNAMDINITGALDKRAAQTDTLQSVVSLAGAGRMIGKYAAGANANTTYLVSNANSLIDATALTADREYTLSNTNAIAGDKIEVLNTSSFYVRVKRSDGTLIMTIGGVASGAGESSWCEFLFDGTHWKPWSFAPPIKDPGQVIFEIDGSWTQPEGWSLWLWEAVGGGGGGGGGTGSAGADSNGCGGGGGGGAQIVRDVIADSPPGSVYNIANGSGGLAGVGGTAHQPSGTGDGGDGGDTILKLGATPIRRAAGAGGGKGGDGSNTNRTSPVEPNPSVSPQPLFSFAAGGAPVRQSPKPAAALGSIDFATHLQWAPGAGGRGMSKNASLLSAVGHGQGSSTGSFGGARGTHGVVDAGAYYGGGPGGGGGGGWGGDGGLGGNGGDGSNAGAPGNGQSANAGVDNTGSGGGGGGSAGASDSTSGVGGTGGTGGTGFTRITKLR